ncbi:MAG: hypothetical protein ACI89Z_001494 [Porticoccus sp.]|jgi:hypothetical protein
MLFPAKHHAFDILKHDILGSVMDKKTLKKWATKSAWSQRELQEICCGLEPGGARDNQKDLNEAIEEIRRAVLMGDLECKEPIDMEREDRFYDHHRFFQPIDAWVWGKEHFETFPDFSQLFSIDDIKVKTRIKGAAQLLTQSGSWSSLQKQAIKAVGSFPEWKSKQKKISMAGNLTHWIQDAFDANTRETEIIKAVLRDLYDIK